MAPEIVRRVEYEGKPVDIWSLGILLYALLCGCFPFRAKAYPDLYRRIARGTFQIPEELSAPVKDLLRALLTVDPEQRVTAHAALRHSWLQVQYVNAPNMDKLRQEITFLISEKPADDLDEQVLSELIAFGLSRDELIRLVLTKTHSSLATLYYLLLDVIVARRRAAGGGGKGKLQTNAAISNGNNNNNNNGNLSSKYVQQVRKTVGSGSNNTSNNFPNAILTQKTPVTSGPITVSQLANETAQQLQYNYDYSAAINSHEGREQRARPQSASHSRVSNLNSLMNNNGNGNLASNGSNLPPQTQTQTLQQQPVAASVQRPLSAYAGRR